MEGVNVYVVVPVADVLIVAGLHVPAILLFEVDGNDGGVAFWHSGPICVKVGVTLPLMVMSIVAVVAHPDVAGVNVYVVVPVADVLIVEGLQVPVILLFDVVGNAGAVEFWQSGPGGVNVGVTLPLMVISIVAVVAQPGVDGVKVYVVVPIADVLIVAGFQVPVILLFDVVGSDGGVVF